MSYFPSFGFDNSGYIVLSTVATYVKFATVATYYSQAIPDHFRSDWARPDQTSSGQSSSSFTISPFYFEPLARLGPAADGFWSSTYPIINFGFLKEG